MLKIFQISDEAQREALEKELTIQDNLNPFLDTSTSDSVSQIIRSVVENKDKALIELTRQFDGVELKSEDLKVKESEYARLEEAVDEDFKKAFQKAKENIHQFHSRQKARKNWLSDKETKDHFFGETFTALESIGAYVPGGTAPLVSTLLMICVPAKIAGVPEIRVVTPPSREGKINPYILYACQQLEVRDIYKIGGAQAIAALAFGTETVKKVDKICGPGNKYVTEAKRQVYGYVGIDMLAGPSEVCIVADRSANPGFIAADVLSQAEHDPESRAFVVTDNAQLASNVCDAVSLMVKDDSRKKILEESLKKCLIVVTDSIEQAFELVQEIAPEHLEIMVSKIQKVKKRSFYAGAVFLGEYTPVVTGDLYAGPNHVLPTQRRAKYFSPLGVYDFLRRSSVLYYSREKLKEAAKDIMTLAQVEQLPWHRNSVSVRFQQEKEEENADEKEVSPRREDNG